MYKFKGLKKEMYSQNDLSSVAMLYNGKLIEDEIDGYQTLTVKGREYIAFETEDAGNVAGKDGVIPITKSLPSRDIEVRYLLKENDSHKFQLKYRKLMALLDTEVDVPIKFRDEMDVTYYGQMIELGEVTEESNTSVASFIIRCYDPYKYNDEFTATGNPVSVFVGTPYKTHPKEISIKLKSDATKITVDNNSTGRHIILNGDYKNGDSIVINIDNKTITQNNRNIMNNLDYIASDFHEFWLHDGDTIQVTPKNSDLTISFQGRWK